MKCRMSKDDIGFYIAHWKKQLERVRADQSLSPFAKNSQIEQFQANIQKYEAMKCAE